MFINDDRCSLTPNREQIMSDERNKPESYWREKLTPQQYHVLREAGTEAPFSGELYEVDSAGVYKCAACGEPIFEAGAKFHSGCGWPSFSAPIDEEGVEEVEDRSHGMQRTEIRCSNCGSHLGHVFNDGPPPGGLRYCINSVAMTFEEA
jgi:peptide-methionine (R)-S-oxide reductase